MGVITLKIDDELEAQLRKRVGRVHGVTKGAISKSVEEAITLWLSEPSLTKHARRQFVALLDGKKVAEEGSLGALAKRLREHGIDPRSVEIRTVPPAPEVVRLGLRTRSNTG